MEAEATMEWTGGCLYGTLRYRATATRHRSTDEAAIATLEMIWLVHYGSSELRSVPGPPPFRQP